MEKLTSFFEKYNLTQSQKAAIEKLETFIDTPSNNQNVFLLKGFAGTGKTFITKGLTEYLKIIGRAFILAAPTGKAAKVISKKTLCEAFTIHKTIYSLKENSIVEYKDKLDKTFKLYMNLRVNEDADNTIYIIDEASMISDKYNSHEFIKFGSGYLLQDLINYINIDCNDHNKKVIFIGDNAQLPPIEMNFSPALDKNYLVSKFGLLVDEIELTEVVRQKSTSGILKNSLPIRQALKKEIFNQLEIDVKSYNDVTHEEHENFLKAYLRQCNNPTDQNTIIIAYSNASVKEYNNKIREHFFPGNINNIVVNDKILVIANNTNHEIFISNGDFGIIQKISSKSETRTIRHGNINETLNFRDAVIVFEQLNGQFYSITCKIIENILYSEQPNLTSNQYKALYIDFLIRHPKLKPNTKEWQDALKADPYFNALRIKFGYAITCHKAQGSEWKNVFLNCKTHQSQLCKDYFRWLYTAITRASDKLFVFDEPHISMFSKLQKDIYISNTTKTISIDKKSEHDTSKITQSPSNIEEAIYLKVKDILNQNKISIEKINHHQYCEIYTLKYSNEVCNIKIIYNSKNKITKIYSNDTNILAKLVENLLKVLENTIIFNPVKDIKPFNEDFLEEYYNFINKIISPHGIEITNIEHLYYLEKYTFKYKNEISIINFYYNNKKQFSRSQPSNNSSIKLSNFILSLLQG
ncbi:AAA domain protein [Campylobacter peloridis]|uniref:AAA domain protein n=1 Tax=Campylobacter peloridis TaxID=488546 RepID=A0ABX6TTS9_9BACT|nr:AAA domain protein [Campylobacter peloridis]AJC85419.1 RecD-like DNA helicase (AAA domain) [Campylobacter peloridis LMG 23910]QOQ89425.1 AAA domain protein [Campylobacter peloridis]